MLTGGGFLCDGSRCMDPSVLCDEVGHCDDCTDEDQDTCFDAQCSHGIQLLNSTVLHVVHERPLLPYLLADHVRCGLGWMQCMRKEHLCDGFVDCVTEFDEEDTACGYYVSEGELQ